MLGKRNRSGQPPGGSAHRPFVLLKGATNPNKARQTLTGLDWREGEKHRGEGLGGCVEGARTISYSEEMRTAAYGNNPLENQ